MQGIIRIQALPTTQPFRQKIHQPTVHLPTREHCCPKPRPSTDPLVILPPYTPRHIQCQWPRQKNSDDLQAQRREIDTAVATIRLCVVPPQRRENVVAVGIAVEAVWMAEEEARGLVRRLRIRTDEGETCEAVVDVCGFEDEMGETVDEVPEVEDLGGGGHRRLPLAILYRGRVREGAEELAAEKKSCSPVHGFAPSNLAHFPIFLHLVNSRTMSHMSGYPSDGSYPHKASISTATELAEGLAP